MFIDSVLIKSEEFDSLNSVVWYDGDIKIELTESPKVQTRDCNKYLQSSEEFRSARAWPHKLMHEVFVRITKKNKVYTFKINTAYCYDGATIPRLFWRLIGAPSDPRFIIGALLHDVLCQHKEYVDRDRNLATCVLERCCRCTGTGAVTRFLMYWSVEIYQMLVGKW